MSPKRHEAVIRIHDALFRPQHVINSPRAKEELGDLDYVVALGRHIRGEWGEVTAERARENEANVSRGGGCLLSAFRSSTGELFWIATDETWRWTGVMFPEEFPEWEEMVQEQAPIVH